MEPMQEKILSRKEIHHAELAEHGITGEEGTTQTLASGFDATRT